MNAQVTQVRFEGTAEQMRGFEQRCEVTEYMFSQTLANRIQGMKPEVAEVYIRDWFKSVRDMAIANWILTGIKTTVTEQ